MSLIPGSSSAPSIHPNGIASGSVATPTPLLIPYGITGQIGNVRASSSTAQTLVNADNDIQIFTPTAAHDVNLPTTSVASGRAFYIVNRGGYALTIKSSGGNTVITPSTGTVTNGVYLVRALQAAPTTAAHWQVEYVYETGTFTPSDQSGAGLTFTNPQGYYNRLGNSVLISIFVTYPVTANGSAAVIGELPFAASRYSALPVETNSAQSFVGFITPASSLIYLRNTSDAGITNAQMSAKYFVGGINYII